MAITLDTTPRGAYLSRNQVAFQFDCPDAVDTPSVSEYRFSIISTLLEENDTLQITWSYEGTDYDITFTFKDVPDANLYEILSNSTAPDRGYIENTLIPALLSHPDIAQFFDIAVEEDTFFGFRLTSRVEGPITLAFTATGFTFTEGSTAGVVEVRAADYLASAWVYVAQAHNSPLDEFTKLEEIELYPDLAGKAVIDVSEILDAYFSTPETPTDTTNAPVVCTQVFRKFFILYGQKFGDPVERKKQSRTDILTVIKGGMTHAEWLSTEGNTFDHPLFRRLHTLRLRREVSANQNDWLFLTPGTDLADTLLRAVLYYTDGTTETADLWTGQSLTAFTTYQFAAGFTQAGIKAIADTAAKTCYKYTLQVGQNPSLFAARSERATFYLQPYHTLATVFEYENSLGGIESWRMVGNRFLTGATSSDEYRRMLPPLADALFEELTSYNEEDNLSITFNTGPMHKSDALAFRDFLRSRHKWVITPEGSRLPFRTPGQDYSLDSQNTEADYTRNHEFRAVFAPTKGVSNTYVGWE
jgi:hypothetical protein